MISRELARRGSFVDNSTPRPQTLCGIDRGDHYGTDAYNAE